MYIQGICCQEVSDVKNVFGVQVSGVFKGYIKRFAAKGI